MGAIGLRKPYAISTIPYNCLLSHCLSLPMAHQKISPRPTPRHFLTRNSSCVLGISFRFNTGTSALRERFNHSNRLSYTKDPIPRNLILLHVSNVVSCDLPKVLRRLASISSFVLAVVLYFASSDNPSWLFLKSSRSVRQIA